AFSLNTFAGVIKGRVIDEDGLEVFGANVLIEGTGTGTVTDFDGRFEIPNLEKGTYSLVISYLSFNTQIIADIRVGEGDEVTTLGDIKLTSSAVALGDVVVTAKALKNTETAVQTLKRKSIGAIDGISSQAFSNTGDSDAGSAMKRVTGVSVDGGKYVFVRGLGGRYSKTTLNGLEVPGLDPDRNSVQMDIFPTSLIENIIVYKTFTPNLPGTFTGGLVEISTKDFPETFTLNASVKVGFNPNVQFNSNYITYEGSSTDFLGYDNGVRAIPSSIENSSIRPDFVLAATQPDASGELTKAFNQVVEAQTRTAPVNHGFSLSVGNETSLFGKSLGFIAGVTYKRDFSFYENGVTGRYQFISAESDTLRPDKVYADNRSSDEVLWSAIASATLKLNKANKISFSFLHNQSGSTTTRDQKGYLYLENLGYEEKTLAYMQRQLDVTQVNGKHGFGENGKFELNWAGALSFAKMDQPDLRFLNNAFEEIGGTTVYSIQPSIGLIPTRYWRNLDELTFNGKVDLKYNFKNWTAKNTSISVGGAYNYKERSFGEKIYQFNSNSNQYPGNFGDYFADENIISSENSAGVFVDESTLAGNQYEADASVISAYAMTELPLTDKLKSVFGARMEIGTVNFTNVDLNDKRLLDNTDILPAFGLIYEPVKDKMNVRMSYNRTIARPTFKELAPVVFFEFLNNSFLLGNPELNRTTVDNVDLRWEYFMKPGELISFSLFYKNFKDPIELTNNPQAKNGEWIFENVEKANVYGIEFEVRKRLDFIAPLKNFTIGSNVTLIKSEAAIKPLELQDIRAVYPNASDVRPLYSQSPYIINGFINYRNQIGTQANISYNVLGEKLYLVEIGALPDVYEQPFHSLNFKVSQQFGPEQQFKVSFGVKNILDSTFERSSEFEGQTYLFQSYKPGRNFSVGFSYNMTK
ncbi:MAG: TonB-dependent receptor, partial [Bacteroidetes bacterium]